MSWILVVLLIIIIFQIHNLDYNLGVLIHNFTFFNDSLMALLERKNNQKDDMNNMDSYD
jgi:hypothetical protein